MKPPVIFIPDIQRVIHPHEVFQIQRAVFQRFVFAHLLYHWTHQPVLAVRQGKELNVYPWTWLESGAAVGKKPRRFSIKTD